MPVQGRFVSGAAAGGRHLLSTATELSAADEMLAYRRKLKEQEAAGAKARARIAELEAAAAKERAEEQEKGRLLRARIAELEAELEAERERGRAADVANALVRCAPWLLRTHARAPPP